MQPQVASQLAPEQVSVASPSAGKSQVPSKLLESGRLLGLLRPMASVTHPGLRIARTVVLLACPGRLLRAPRSGGSRCRVDLRSRRSAQPQASGSDPLSHRPIGLGSRPSVSPGWPCADSNHRASTAESLSVEAPVAAESESLGSRGGVSEYSISLIHEC